MYDLTILLSEDKQKMDVKNIIESAGGTITNTDAWGKRSLAYPIKKQAEAFYFTFTFSAPAKAVSALKQKLNFDEKIIRYLLLKNEDEAEKKPLPVSKKK